MGGIASTVTSKKGALAAQVEQAVLVERAELMEQVVLAEQVVRVGVALCLEREGPEEKEARRVRMAHLVPTALLAQMALEPDSMKEGEGITFPFLTLASFED